MSSYNKFRNHNYSESTDKNVKVFINPNFNRAISQSSSMYLNPNFSQPKTHVPVNNTANKTKIYLNPNFIRTNNTLKSLGFTSTIVNNDNISIPANTLNITTNLNKALPIKQILPQLHLKSRYSIVRHNLDNKIADTKSLEKVTSTVKISKYKSVPIHDVKKTLENPRHTDDSMYRYISKLKRPQDPIQINKTNKCNKRPDLLERRYKIIRRNKDTKLSNSEIKLSVTKKSPNTSTKFISTRADLKPNRKQFKKNNIPCPLFRKYGKCLRHAQGNCDFLHDKKHISICRKFLNGACHDERCLLSHDLTTNKMPTCSFYLKGMCSKVDCPYLHVKLNEKTKICTDFLKGYCEKGDNCLNRHVNICPSMASTGVCYKSQCSYPHTCDKVTKYKKMTLKSKNTNRNYKCNSVRRVSSNDHDKKSETGTQGTDCRYYKDVENDANVSGTCEVIKPTRCKLGILPSFIQL